MGQEHMKSRVIPTAKHPELRGSLAAIQHVAALARKIAIQNRNGDSYRPGWRNCAYFCRGVA
jgi:hypothetical protein